MSVKRFVIKTVCKIAVVIVLSYVAMVLVRSPVITNELAMSQMQNSNEVYILTDIMQNMRPTIDVATRCANILISFTIGMDIRKFIVSNKKENT